MIQIVDLGKYKIASSEDYNSCLDSESGFFFRFGKTKDEDPDFAPAPEILDIEVTTICEGVVSGSKRAPCKFCYKSNTKNGKNMSFDTFKKILDGMFWKDNNGKEVSLLGQIAFGADSQATSNPDLWKMMEYTRSRGIVPNITVADISDDTADKLVKHVGACAVSRYANKDVCYDSVKKLTDRGLNQVNLHALVSLETFDSCMETIQDRLNDPRLSRLNSIVFLSLKKKGRGEGYHRLPDDQYKQLIDLAIQSGISFGCDSCSAKRLMDILKGYPNFKKISQSIDPCESSCFSFYCDVDGNALPCSFSSGLVDPMDATQGDFLKIWNDSKTQAFRQRLLSTKDKNDMGCRECPLFDV